MNADVGGSKPTKIITNKIYLIQVHILYNYINDYKFDKELIVFILQKNLFKLSGTNLQKHLMKNRL